MNHYVNTRLAEQRLQQTARQARTAWWRSQPVTAAEVPGAGPPPEPRLGGPGHGPDRRGLGGTMSMPSSGLFGRDRELGEADEALTHALTGTPQALLVGGDAGIGKTTLVAEPGRARPRARLHGAHRTLPRHRQRRAAPTRPRGPARRGRGRAGRGRSRP